MPADYDPPASQLVGSAQVAERVDVRVHTVLQAIRAGYLWSIDLAPPGATKGQHFTTWEAVADWTRSSRFRGANVLRRTGAHHNVDRR